MKAIIKTVMRSNKQKVYEVYLKSKGSLRYLGCSADYEKACFLKNLHDGQ